MNKFSTIGLVVVAAVLITGCGQPPQVSRGNRKLVDGLRTATSSKQIEWVDECAKQLEEGKRQGTVTDVEYDEFNAIIALARDKKWQEAEAEVIRLGKAQRPTAEDVERLKTKEGRTPGK